MNNQAFGILMLSLACAGLGFFVGWMGGVAEGRALEREQKGPHP